MTREIGRVRSHMNAPPLLRQRFGPLAESDDKRRKRRANRLRKEMNLHNEVRVEAERRKRMAVVPRPLFCRNPIHQRIHNVDEG